MASLARVSLRRVSPREVSAQESNPVDAKTLEQARVILEAVRVDGERGLLKYGHMLGDLPKDETRYIKTRAELKAAYDTLPPVQRDILTRTAQRIRKFAEMQRASVRACEINVPGGTAGQDISPVETAGCYAPGGRYPLPSSVLMTTITALVAGVKNVWVASPRPAKATLAAAYIAGCENFLAVGGAQAIGAMAYGIEGVIPPCDCIVGPGNRWVTAAKQLVMGRCKIDMLAGPSECLVIADSTANPATVAADLIAQAEHDTDALAILVSTDPNMLDRVDDELSAQVSALPQPNQNTARAALSHSFSVLCDDIDTAIRVSDTVGPEHLEVMTADADSVAAKLAHFGGLFIGNNSAEVMGDYGAGPNHVLPTSGTARYTGGLSVFTFLRVRTWMNLKHTDSMQTLVSDAVGLARMEGLEGHARSAEQRLLLKAKL